MKRIVVLTSGSDCSGINTAIRGVVRYALLAGLEVVGINKEGASLIAKTL